MEKFSMEDELQSEKKDESSNIDQIEAKKLTPEIKEMIMEKVTDIFAEGNAHHSTFAVNRLYDSGNFYNIKNLLSPDGEFIGRRKDYFDSKVELNSDNIRDYFSLETPFVNDIKNQFLYGIQSHIASDIQVAKNAEEYRKKIKDTPSVSFDERRNTHVFFNLIGRNTTSFTQPDGWFHGVSFIFNPPKRKFFKSIVTP
jgi:hypothetical protein